MRTLLAIILCCFSVVDVVAQEDTEQLDDVYRDGITPVSSYSIETPSYSDSIRLPELDNYGRVPTYRSWYCPSFGLGMGGWELHKGLNVGVGLSAFTSFGKGSFSGWSRDISAVYAAPVNNRLSVALGGYINSLSSSMGSYNEGALTAVLNYRFNEHWEAFLYAQKSFMHDDNMRMPYLYYPYSMNTLNPLVYGGDRIGGGVRYNFNENSSIQFQFDYVSMPDFHKKIQDHWEQPQSK